MGPDPAAHPCQVKLRKASQRKDRPSYEPEIFGRENSLAVDLRVDRRLDPDEGGGDFVDGVEEILL